MMERKRDRYFQHQTAKLVAITEPLVDEQKLSAEEFVVYAARVSNPPNQLNMMSSQKLLQYLIKHGHWSPFEMVAATVEIKTTRDIARQLIRHRSFSFQEFSQRYAEVSDEELDIIRESRFPDPKNRQKSYPVEDQDQITGAVNETTKSGSVSFPITAGAATAYFNDAQTRVSKTAVQCYRTAISYGIAREQARVLLPEGLTPSTLYMAGNLRSWIHYLQSRLPEHMGAQEEHRDIAFKIKQELKTRFPIIDSIVNDSEHTNGTI